MSIVSPEDAGRWASARTLADVGELTALFLEGEIGQTPSHLGPPDTETDPLAGVLAAANRAGFVTHHSQPGVPLDPLGSAQRASVSAFADNNAFAELAEVLAGTNLMITAARAPREESLGPL